PDLLAALSFGQRTAPDEVSQPRILEGLAEPAGVEAQLALDPLDEARLPERVQRTDVLPDRRVGPEVALVAGDSVLATELHQAIRVRATERFLVVADQTRSCPAERAAPHAGREPHVVYMVAVAGLPDVLPGPRQPG